jgi:hypothetical protein
MIYKYKLLIILSWSHQEFYKFWSWSDSPHTTVIVLLNTVHPEDGRRRRQKHVGVINKQCIWFISAFVGSFMKRILWLDMQPLRPCSYSHRGTGGHGCLMQATSSNSQFSAPGHWISLQGSWHWHFGHPSSSRAKPCGHSMRQVWAAQGFGSVIKSIPIFITLCHMFINPSPSVFQSPLAIVSPLD